MNVAICILPVVPVRAEPSDKSEMVSQLLRGEQVTVLDENAKWLMIRCHHDGYVGWVSSKQLMQHHPQNEIPGIVDAAALNFDGICYIPAGSVVTSLTSAPEGTFHQNPEIGIRTACSMFIGSPYLWGGRTALGIDCSGFSQLVMRLNNRHVLRDASQQASEGEVVSFIHESVDGDLAFFDNAEGRIIHVGIVLTSPDPAERMIVHASGSVRIDALDHQGIYNRDTDEYTHNLRIIRRISPNNRKLNAYANQD